MTIEVELTDGRGSSERLKIDKLGSAETKNKPYPLEYEDVTSTSQTIFGFNERHDAEEDDPTWQLRQRTTDGIITKSNYAGNGEFKLRWDQRTEAFLEVLFSNKFSTLFDGSNDHILIGDVPELNFDGNNPFSVSAWLKTGSTNQQAFFSKQGSSNNAGYRFTIQSNEARFHLSGGSASNRIEVQSPNLSLSDDNWHHVVMMYDGSQSGLNGVSMVIDGVDQTSALDIATDGLSLPTSTTVGAQVSGRNGTLNIFNGLIDEVSLYSIELTVVQAQEIYGGTKPNNVKALSFKDDAIYWNRLGDSDSGGNVFPTYIDEIQGLNGTAINMNLSSINVETP